MTNYREIVTKAIIGKNKTTIKSNYEFSCNEMPNTILGCCIINNHFKGSLNGNIAQINGQFDINVWYSYDNDTKTNVINDTISYNDLINIKSKIKTNKESEIIVKVLKQPECRDVKVNNNEIDFNIEKELGIEVVGDEKIKILTEDNEDDWQNLNDLDENISNEIDNEVKEDNII